MAAATDGPGQWLIMWTRSRATRHVDGAVDGPDARAGATWLLQGYRGSFSTPRAVGHRIGKRRPPGIRPRDIKTFKALKKEVDAVVGDSK